MNGDDEDDESMRVLVRSSDPETSHIAAAVLDGSFKVRTWNERIEDSLRRRGPQTQREVCIDIGMASEMPSITSRFARIERTGRIRRFRQTEFIMNILNEKGEIEPLNSGVVQTKKNPKTKHLAELWEVTPDEEVTVERAKFTQEEYHELYEW